MKRTLWLAVALLFANCAFAQTPSIDHITPNRAQIGSGDFTLAVSGTGFVFSSIVYWNGAPLTTTYISDSQITAAVPGAKLNAVGAVQVSVSASSGSSNVSFFRVISPVAQVESWRPTYFTAGADAFITIFGRGFQSNAQVYFDWIPVTTTYVAPLMLNAAISGTAIHASGTNHSIHVINGLPATPTNTIVVSPQTLSLGSSTIGVASSTQMATVTNTGSATVNISGVSIGGVNAAEFGFTTTCGATLTSMASCTATVTMTPAELGARVAFLSVADDAVGSPQSINLTGTGNPTVTVSVSIDPPSLDFASVPQGVPSTTQNIVVTNTGLPNYVISSIVPGGSTDFVDTGDCTAATYTAGQHCQFAETLTPSSVGSVAASIVITDNAPGSPRTISLAGLGVLPGPVASINPTSMAFGTITQSTPSSPITVNLMNRGTTNLTISAIAVASSTFTADFVKSGLGCSTSTVLAPGEQCPVTSTFTPSTTSAESANISITDNAEGSPHIIPMSGTGQAAGAGHHMDLTWTASNSASVTGYNIYRSSSSGGPYTLLTPTPVSGTSYSDLAVTSGATYFYVITAVGTNPPYNPTESLNSTQVTGTIP